MRPLERMIEEKKQKQAAEQEKQKQEWTPDEVEILMERRRMRPLDSAPDVFAENLEKRFGGLNTAQSVFDKTAVFRTKKDE